MKNIFNYKSLSKKYIILLSILATSILSIIVVKFIYLKNQNKLNEIINISGRQRMLSQRIANLSQKVYLKKDKKEIIKLKKAKNLFKNTHNKLINIKKWEEINNYYKESNLDLELNQYVNLAEKIINNSKDKNKAILLIQKNEETILAKLNKAVFLYEKIANKEINNSNKLELFGFLFIILILIIQYIKVFKPFAKSLAKSYYETLEKNKKLEIQSNRIKYLSKIKNTFLANMSHELKTPLNSIIGTSNILKTSDLSEEQKDLIETISYSGNHLNAIIQDVLDYSLAENHKLKLKKEEFKIENLINNSLNLANGLVGKKDILISKKITKDIPELKGDPLRISQVVNGLLSNAIKFTEKGEVKLNVSGNKSKDKYLLSISIEDSGKGIKKELRNNIFESFSQEDNSYSRSKGGIGLGLSLIKELVQLMNGRIEMYSEEGIGSSFTFRLPLDYKKEIPKEKNELPNHKILVVEDNKMNQKLANLIFKKLGYNVDFADNGVFALDKVKENKYSIIFMDLQMPEMNGFECSEKLISQYGEDCPPIIALTANTFEKDKQKCFEIGMKDFISKPIKVENIINALKKY